MKNLLILISSVLLTSCTDNWSSKNLGGTMIIDLPKGEKLVNITWKEESVWYLTRPMTGNETPQESKFQEKSPKGIIEGTVIIREH